MIELNNHEHGKAIASSYGGVYNPLNEVVLSHVSQGGQLLGGVIYSDYTTNSIAISAAGIAPNWISKTLVWVTFHYPFVQLGCKLVLAKTSSGNVKSLNLLSRLGLYEVARIPEVYLDGDLVVMGIKEAECGWHKLTPPSNFEGFTNG